MHSKEKFMKKQLVAAALSIGLFGPALTAPANANDGWGEKKKIKHVLLISVDGLHALDVANYVKNHKGSALAELAEHGVTYSNARTPSLSDSFPGLLALVTGGSPLSHGLFYDVSYDRTVFPPAPTLTCAGQPGNMMVFDESIDQYDNSGSSPVSLNKIDPNALPQYINKNGQCDHLYPHQALRTNTIFEVVKHELHGQTAWADKHPAYDLVRGPSGTGIDDLYTPEVTNFNGFDNTISVVCTANNDALKVAAILNQIGGKTSDGMHTAPIPTVFGMNFQAVSVGQKLASDNPDGACTADTQFTGQPGGYKDGLGTPTAVLDYGLKRTDDALWSMINALKNAGIYESTLFIVSAKHGQSPVNPLKIKKPGHFTDLVDASDPAGAILVNTTTCTVAPCGFVQDDDIALIWLPDQSKTTDVANYINNNPDKLHVDEVLAGRELTLKFNDPKRDSRTPDIIVQPNYGVVYTTATKNKNAEHGGMSFADTNVGLIVSNPEFDRRVVKTPVATSQVAATILQALGIDPSELDAVRKEGTTVLPFASEHDGE
jgi:hypothetical protein